MADAPYQLYATDSLLKRNRGGRLVILVVYILISFLIPLIGWRIANDWFSYGMIGGFIGVAVQIIVLGSTLDRFFVKVGALRAFVTVDLLRAFFRRKSIDGDGDKGAYISYGPGFHVSYPWESRAANYNVSLEEASETFTVKVQTEKGTLTAKGSVRMRPDITELVPFIGGVAVIANDITDLIKAFIIQTIAAPQVSKGGTKNDTSIMKILESSGEFNKRLNEYFGKGDVESKNPDVSKFEERFGVSVGDVTISELLPSEELQKTMTGRSEAEVIALGTAELLGYKTMSAVRTAISKGKLSQEDLNRARDRFLATSDNIKMNLDSNEYNIRLEGIDPETIREVAKNAPAIAAALGATRKGKKNG